MQIKDIIMLIPDPPKAKFGSPKIIHEGKGYMDCVKGFLENFNRRFGTTYKIEDIERLKKR